MIKVLSALSKKFPIKGEIGRTHSLLLALIPFTGACVNDTQSQSDGICLSVLDEDKLGALNSKCGLYNGIPGLDRESSEVDIDVFLFFDELRRQSSKSSSPATCVLQELGLGRDGKVVSVRDRDDVAALSDELLANGVTMLLIEGMKRPNDCDVVVLKLDGGFQND